MNPFALSGLLTVITSLVCGLVVLYHSPNKKLARIWFLFSISVAVYGVGTIVFASTKSPTTSIYAARWMYVLGVLWIPSLYLHFVSIFLDIPNRRLIIANYFISLFFCTLMPTPYMFSDCRWLFNSMHYPIGSGVFPIFFVWFMGLVFYSHFLLARVYIRVSPLKRNQIKYFFLATALGFTGGCMAFLPDFQIDIYPWGNFCTCIYPLIIAYAIVKHHLMDINMVFRKSLVYSLMTAMLSAIYLVLLTQGSHLLQSVFGASTLMISVFAACLITAVFLPLRNRIQSFVDKYFFSSWADQPLAREIAAGFSHELKSPLAGLSMQAQMALLELEDLEKKGGSLKQALPKIRHELNYILKQAMDAARRIEAVRGVADTTPGQMDPVDLPAVMENALCVLEPLLGEYQVTIRNTMPSELPPVLGYAKQLEIVFINLMKNALQAMNTFKRPEPHTLTLGGSAQNGRVGVSVRDTGPGIPTTDLAHIFDAHFTTKGRQGTGMGLFLSHQIVKAHSGSIDIRSQEGQGTEFIVYLPRYAFSEGAGAAA
jgi:signal transduction histidine kinase